jgi:tRNA dimethylallyltransferase
MRNNKVLIIAGPTAVGKTKIAHSLALLFDGEIISADSRKIYKYLDIGTAKPSQELMKEIPYYFISIIQPDEEFSAYEFKILAEKIIKDILKRGKLPIVVGGSGFYISALTDGLFEAPKADKDLREKLKKQPKEVLYKKLQEVDFEVAKSISKNDVYRIIRALEVYYLTGKPMSYHHKYCTKKEDFNFIKICLNIQRQDLYKRIEERTDKMIQAGLVEEVKTLANKYSLEVLKKKGIGYKELSEYLSGELSLEEAIIKIKKNTKNFAKRQLIWFRGHDYSWFNPIYDDLIGFIEGNLNMFK